MLENIKTMLGIVNNDLDDIILLYIDKVAAVVLAYTQTKELNKVLESFVEDKVASIAKSKVGSGTENTREIKSVSRGDTKIEYNVGTAISTDTSKGAILSESDKKYLNSFKPTSWRLL